MLEASKKAALKFGNRASPSDVSWKYEKSCLLISDFETETPEVIENMQKLL